MKCKYKESCGYEFCLDDCCPEFETAVETKADRIRAMSDEEMAEHEVRITQDGMYYECSDGETFAIYEDAIAHEIKWLKQPAEEEPHATKET